MTAKTVQVETKFNTFSTLLSENLLFVNFNMIYIVLEIMPQNIQKNELFNAILLLIVAKENYN